MPEPAVTALTAYGPVAYDSGVIPAPTKASDPADALASRAVREVCRRHAGDFYFASAFLPRAKREAAHAVYAFCRMVREAVEVTAEEPAAGAWAMRHRPLNVPPGSPTRTGQFESGSCCSDSGADRVALLRERLEEIESGRTNLPAPFSRSEPQHTIHAFARATARYQVPREALLDLAEGSRRDQSVWRYATWASLERHCVAVGGSVALALGCVFGLTHSGAAGHALKLGAAVRLARILRDLRTDAARGRIYLPLEDLATFRYGERDLAASVLDGRFRELMRFQISRARGLFREAADGLCWVAGDGARLAAATMIALSSAHLDAIERRGYGVFSHGIELSPGQKLRILPMAFRLSRRRAGAAFVDAAARGNLVAGAR